MIYILSGLGGLAVGICWVLTRLLGDQLIPWLPYIASGGALLITGIWFSGVVSVVCKAVVGRLAEGGGKRVLWGEVYDWMMWMYPNQEWKIMNHGYASDSDSGYTIELSEKEEFERYGYQLYHYIGTGMKEFAHFKHLNILEVGCGRGGGLAFLTKYLRPNSATGIDTTAKCISFCQANYRSIPGLNFVLGDAEAIPRANQCFDIVIDVCSSHCYTNFPRYLSEVERVLNYGGRFFLADFRRAGEIPGFERDLYNSGLTVEKKDDISEAVKRALKFDTLRRTKLVRANTWRRNW